MSTLIHIGLTVFFVGLIILLIRRSSFFQVQGVAKKWLSLLFLLKVAAGLALWLVYTYYYPYRNTSDAFRYFDDAMVILSTLPENPTHFFNFLFGVNLDSPEMVVYYDQMRGWTSSYSYGIAHDNPTVIRINVLIGLVSFGYYHVHTVIFSFLSFVGTWSIFKAIQPWIHIKARPIAIFLLIATPSLLFWTSGVLKEAPLILGFGVLIYSLFQLFSKWDSPKHILLTLLSILFLYFIKGYVLFAMVPALVGVVVWKCVSDRWRVLAFILAHAIVFFLALNAHYFFVGGDLLYVLSKKQTDFYNVAEMQNAGSTIEIPKVESIGSFLANAPGALYRTYLRPDWRDLSGGIQVLGMLESLWTLLLLLLMFGMRQMKIQASRIALYFFVSIVLCLGVIIGTTVPVVGAIIRYKVPGLLLIVALFCLVFDWTKLPFLNPEKEGAHPD